MYAMIELALLYFIGGALVGLNWVCPRWTLWLWKWFWRRPRPPYNDIADAVAALPGVGQVASGALHSLQSGWEFYESEITSNVETRGDDSTTGEP